MRKDAVVTHRSLRASHAIDTPHLVDDTTGKEFVQQPESCQPATLVRAATAPCGALWPSAPVSAASGRI